jgi:hypothetical protein
LISGINPIDKDRLRPHRPHIASHHVAPGIESASAEIPDRLGSEFRADGALMGVIPAYKDPIPFHNLLPCANRE